MTAYSPILELSDEIVIDHTATKIFTLRKEKYRNRRRKKEEKRP